MSGFDNPWYASMIEERSPGYTEDDETPESSAIIAAARANLVAACIIAQALDGVAEAIKNHGENQ